MFLKDKATGDVVEIMDLTALFDPFMSQVKGRLHAGEELQDVTEFAKIGLIFPSGEPLPRCWVDPDYRKVSVA
ncbi:MAG: acetyltransferase [Gammaproteobacteria bacterium]|nr:acetyltransferase [Gammaproteobacteria bacterium]